MTTLFRDLQFQTNLNSKTDKKERDTRVDLLERFNLGVKGLDFSTDDIYLKYQGYKYYDFKPQSTSIRPDLSYNQIVGIKPSYIQNIKNTPIDMVGYVIPRDKVKKWRVSKNLFMICDEVKHSSRLNNY